MPRAHPCTNGTQCLLLCAEQECVQCDSHEYASSGGGAMTIFTANAFYPVPYGGPRLAAMWVERDPTQVEQEWQRYALARALVESNSSNSSIILVVLLNDFIYSRTCNV